MCSRPSALLFSGHLSPQLILNMPNIFVRWAVFWGRFRIRWTLFVFVSNHKSSASMSPTKRTVEHCGEQFVWDERHDVWCGLDWLWEFRQFLSSSATDNRRVLTCVRHTHKPTHTRGPSATAKRTLWPKQHPRTRTIHSNDTRTLSSWASLARKDDDGWL